MYAFIDKITIRRIYFLMGKSNPYQTNRTIMKLYWLDKDPDEKVSLFEKEKDQAKRMSP